MDIDISVYADIYEYMETTARILKALSEEARLRILVLLMSGERCVCELMAVLEMPQSTISRHLSYLKNTGWVKGERRGVWMYYRLADDMDGFQDELLKILKQRLADTERVRNDNDKLLSFLEGAVKTVCG